MRTIATGFLLVVSMVLTCAALAAPSIGLIPYGNALCRTMGSDNSAKSKCEEFVRNNAGMSNHFDLAIRICTPSSDPSGSLTLNCFERASQLLQDTAIVSQVTACRQGTPKRESETDRLHNGRISNCMHQHFLTRQHGAASQSLNTGQTRTGNPAAR